MTEFIMIHDLVNPKTGKTYKDENLEKEHKIPKGALVEFNWGAWHGRGACWQMKARLWITRHTRDCDGTPLYSVSRYQTPGLEEFHSFGEDSLTPIEITPRIRDGYELPEWLKEEE